MAYPFDNTPTSLNMGFTPEIDLTSLGSYGNPLANATSSPFGANALSIGADTASNSGLSNLMSGFSNLFSKDSILGGVSPTGQQTTGWAMPAISVLSGLFGMQQSKQAAKLAKDQLAESRRQFDLNFNAQKQSINTELEDRQRARVASAGGSGAYESVDAYLDKNRIR